VKPVSHNRFYLSPYYPVFGSRMVMIADPWHRQSVGNGLILRPFGDFTGASPSSADGSARADGWGANRAWLARVAGARGWHSRLALAAGTRG
jgi:hypothetical protein